MEITGKELQEKINNNEKVIVEFWAEWCGPCRMVKPIFERVASNNDTEVQMYTMDIDQNKDMLITAIKMEITASGQTEESISLGNSYGEVFVSYRKPSRTLYYDYNWGEDIEKLMPWHIYTRHFKYALDEYFKSLFPDVVIKNVTGAHIG